LCVTHKRGALSSGYGYGYGALAGPGVIAAARQRTIGQHSCRRCTCREPCTAAAAAAALRLQLRLLFAFCVVCAATLAELFVVAAAVAVAEFP
jgi:hypothetical protein